MLSWVVTQSCARQSTYGSGKCLYGFRSPLRLYLKLFSTMSWRSRNAMGIFCVEAEIVPLSSVRSEPCGLSIEVAVCDPCCKLYWAHTAVEVIRKKQVGIWEFKSVFWATDLVTVACHRIAEYKEGYAPEEPNPFSFHLLPFAFFLLLLLRKLSSTSFKMNLASILQHPIEDTQTHTHFRLSPSTSTSPILSPHAGCGVVKSSPKSAKRTQTKAACLGCRQRKSKVGPLVRACIVTSTDTNSHPSATETVRHVECASKGMPNASIPSKKAKPSNKLRKSNSDHTKMYCRCFEIAHLRKAKPSYTFSRAWTSTMLAVSSSTVQSLYLTGEQVCSISVCQRLSHDVRRSAQYFQKTSRVHGEFLYRFSPWSYFCLKSYCTFR